MKTSPRAAVPAGPATARRRPLGALRDGIRDIASRRRLIRYLVAADLKRTHADTLVGQGVVDPRPAHPDGHLLDPVRDDLPARDPGLPPLPLRRHPALEVVLDHGRRAIDLVAGRQARSARSSSPRSCSRRPPAVAGTVSFAFGLIALAFLFLPYHDRLTPWLLAIPLIAAVQFVFSLALASSWPRPNAFYRDIANVLGHVLRLWFYVSPGLYSLGEVPGPGPARTL